MDSTHSSHETLPESHDYNLRNRNNLNPPVDSQSGQAKKMFVCENPGGKKSIHQAGRESIFLPNFQTIHTNYVFKGTKEKNVLLKSKIATHPNI